MGINGFTFQKNTVNYLNIGNGQIDGVKKVYSSIYSYGKKILPVSEQKNCGKILTQDFPYNSKSDNFLDIYQINNMVIASLLDEENFGEIRSIGTIQLYNRKLSEISQEDLARVYYVRKLIGSTVKKCEYWESTL